MKLAFVISYKSAFGDLANSFQWQQRFSQGGSELDL